MKEIRWELIMMPLVSIVLGIYLIMQPGAATVALCSLIGWLICWPVLPVRSIPSSSSAPPL